MKIGAIVKKKLLGYRVDPELVAAYRSAIPNDIQLNISQNGDSYLAIINGIEQKPLPENTFLITEAKTEAELVDMINDLVFAYKKIPENYRPFFKHILKPEGAVSDAKSLSLVKSA